MLFFSAKAGVITTTFGAVATKVTLLKSFFGSYGSVG